MYGAPHGTLEVQFSSFPNGAIYTLADTTLDTTKDDKLYKAEYVGSGTFIISKPKRKKTKQRQSNLKNLKRGSRK
jgi:hypothetical protein